MGAERIFCARLLRTCATRRWPTKLVETSEVMRPNSATRHRAMKVRSRPPAMPPSWFSTRLMVRNSATVATPAQMPVTEDSTIHGRKGFSSREISPPLLPPPLLVVMQTLFPPRGRLRPGRGCAAGAPRTGRKWPGKTASMGDLRAARCRPPHRRSGAGNAHRETARRCAHEHPACRCVSVEMLSSASNPIAPALFALLAARRAGP